MRKPLADSLDTRLSGLSITPALKRRMLSAIHKKGNPPMKKKLSLSLAFAMGLVIISLATAFALTNGFGLFQVMSTSVMEKFGVVRPEAEQMLHRNLASLELEHTKINVTEAAYDGKFLRVVYAVQAKGIEKPFADEPTNMESLLVIKDENGNDASGVPEGPLSRFMDAVKADQVSWDTLDGAEVDGQSVCALGPTGSVSGANPGEVLTWVQFDLTGTTLADPFTVKLRLTGLEKPRHMTFQLPSKNLPGVKALKLPKEQRLDNYRVKMTEALITPFRVYMAAEITVDAGVPMETCDRILRSWMTDAELTDSNRNLALAWVDSNHAGYPLENSNVAFPTQENNFTQSIIDPEKPVKIIISHEFMTAETYPAPLRFGINDLEYVLIPLEEAK
ncbi:MAG: hypothetical protein ACOX6O_00045 [Christensenellales bacterium]|jgi:hypothetical protein